MISIDHHIISDDVDNILIAKCERDESQMWDDVRGMGTLDGHQTATRCFSRESRHKVGADVDR